MARQRLFRPGFTEPQRPEKSVRFGQRPFAVRPKAKKLPLAEPAVPQSQLVFKKEDPPGRPDVGNVETPGIVEPATGPLLQEPAKAVEVNHHVGYSTNGVIQKTSELLTGGQLAKVQAIATRMGADPAKITFHGHDGGTITKGNQIYLDNKLFKESDKAIEFTVGHELSHFITRDNEIFGLGTLISTSLGIAATWLAPGLAGILGGGAITAVLTRLSGGGTVRILANLLSVGSTLTIGAIAAALGVNPILAGIAIAALGRSPILLEKMGIDDKVYSRLLSFFTPETLTQLALETKADLHSATALDAASGGVEHFENAKHETEGLDIYHPPLSFRKKYLSWIFG
ncbi:MAG TPA: hypothetical protein VH988_25755 [Thermoanaerobaculia bacterium]|jgi:hypothetical protein|nr:hypothetical protein [Thermoanaerobaculia bacterium]